MVNTSGRLRHSLAFFIDMDFDAVVSVVPTCRGERYPAKYCPYTCGWHKYRRYAASFGHLKESLSETAALTANHVGEGEGVGETESTGVV